jgi:hypothetical protein
LAALVLLEPKMSKKEWRCSRCGEQFGPGQWLCADGQRHQVELKTYYVSTEGLDVHYGPVTGEHVQNHMRKTISFSRGTFQTADPEQQEFLDAYPGCISFEAWKEAHLTTKERDEQSKRENSRLVQENNTLLAQVQELQAKLTAKGADAQTSTDDGKDEGNLLAQVRVVSGRGGRKAD